MKVSVCITDLPANVHGISANKSGEQIIFINQNDPPIEKMKTYFRGIARQKFKHFHSDKPYNTCEEEAHAFACCEAMKQDAFTIYPPRICELGGRYVWKENKDLRTNIGKQRQEISRGA